jgi:hypothetical protein
LEHPGQWTTARQSQALINSPVTARASVADFVDLGSAECATLTPW